MPVVQQSGAVAFRSTRHGPEVLLVRARQNPNHWIFPKGHVEAGESSPAAALRELREEAGVEGDILASLGTLSFTSNDESIRVDYYLVRYTRPADGSAERETLWCTQEDALQRLSFSDARQLLQSAWPLVRQHAGRTAADERNGGHAT